MLLGYPDSNQERQDQNLQCYHYTIPQFLICGCKGTAFFLFSKENPDFFSKNRKKTSNSCRLSIIWCIFASQFNDIIDKLMEQTRQLVDSIIKGMQEKKGSHIVVADLNDIEGAICSYFVICQGNSPTQVEAIADSVGELTRQERGEKPAAVVGLENAQWVAMDYSDVLVHVFLPDVRAYYDLEHLWADAALTKVEEEEGKGISEKG